jgi:hypothetical protein
MPAGRGWIGELRAAGVVATAEKLALQVRRNSIAPCPSCGAERRGRGDRRGPIGVRRDQLGWRCHRCENVQGDAATLASWCLLGRGAPRDASEWRTIRSWASAAGLVSAAGDGCASPSISRLLMPVAPRRPPPDEVLQLWGRSASVERDTAAVRWLRARGIAPRAVAGLARVLPRGAPLPIWARYNGRPWTVTHRLIVPLYAPRGQMESVHARSLAAVVSGAAAKAASPADHEVTGLVMANPVAVEGLAAGAIGRLVVVEGVPDFLRWAAAMPAVAVVGIASGSWTADVARRVATGSVVEVRTHADAAGERYASAIVATLRGRCEVMRADPVGEPSR